VIIPYMHIEILFCLTHVLSAAHGAKDAIDIQKVFVEAGCWWLTAAIQVSQEAEVRRIEV
jgi:hypothetical protein